MNNSKAVLALIALSFAALAGCEEEGPAERAGERLDDALSGAQDRLEDVREDLEDAAEEVGDALSGD